MYMYSQYVPAEENFGKQRPNLWKVINASKIYISNYVHTTFPRDQDIKKYIFKHIGLNFLFSETPVVEVGKKLDLNSFKSTF